MQCNVFYKYLFFSHIRATLCPEISIESLKNGRERLVITSIPYQVNKSVLNERIAQLVREKKIEGIKAVSYTHLTLPTILPV